MIYFYEIIILIASLNGIVVEFMYLNKKGRVSIGVKNNE